MHLLGYFAGQVTRDFTQNFSRNNHAHRFISFLSHGFNCQTVSVSTNKGNFAILDFYQNTGKERSCFVSGAGEDGFLNKFFDFFIFNGNSFICIEFRELRIIVFVHQQKLEFRFTGANFNSFIGSIFFNGDGFTGQFTNQFCKMFSRYYDFACFFNFCINGAGDCHIQIHSLDF